MLWPPHNSDRIIVLYHKLYCTGMLLLRICTKKLFCVYFFILIWFYLIVFLISCFFLCIFLKPTQYVCATTAVQKTNNLLRQIYSNDRELEKERNERNKEIVEVEAEAKVKDTHTHTHQHTDSVYADRIERFCCKKLSKERKSDLYKKKKKREKHLKKWIK